MSLNLVGFDGCATAFNLPYFGKISIALQLQRILSRSRNHKNVLLFFIVSLFFVNLLCVIVTFGLPAPV